MIVLYKKSQKFSTKLLRQKVGLHMKSETSLVAKQVRLKEWAAQIRECQARPKGMKVDSWCQMNHISKANYYYRLRTVREAYLEQMDTEQTEFVELPITRPAKKEVSSLEHNASSTAIFHLPNGITVDVPLSASSDFIHCLLGVTAYVE